MTNYVTSADGTRIAFDRLGSGSSVILVSGMLCDRHRTRELAERLAESFAVIHYDRRGRGESGNTAPYAVEREIEDLDALIGAAGGSAMMYGHSSGAGLAINAAARGLRIPRLVLHEPPYGADDPESVRNARELAERVQEALEDNRPSDALQLFFAAAGMSPEIARQASVDPELGAMAPTMVYDLEVMGNFSRGGVIPVDLVRDVSMPTLVITGGASPAFFRETAERIATLLTKGTLTVLEGQGHDAPPNAVVPTVAAFLAGIDR